VTCPLRERRDRAFEIERRRPTSWIRHVGQTRRPLAHIVQESQAAAAALHRMNRYPL
jgi:hypothetical protein